MFIKKRKAETPLALEKQEVSALPSTPWIKELSDDYFSIL
jgi:hypothetical protein